MNSHNGLYYIKSLTTRWSGVITRGWVIMSSANIKHNYGETREIAPLASAQKDSELAKLETTAKRYSYSFCRLNCWKKCIKVNSVSKIFE